MTSQTSAAPSAAIELTQELIRRPSVSPEDQGCLQIISARLEALGSLRGTAWRLLAGALVLQIAATLLVPALGPLEFAPAQAASGFLQFAFFPCAALSATCLLLTTRVRAFGPQFWLEATLVALCVGTVLWLAMPHPLAPEALPVRGSWTTGLDAFLGVLAGLALIAVLVALGFPWLAAALIVGVPAVCIAGAILAGLAREAKEAPGGVPLTEEGQGRSPGDGE